MIRKNVFYGVGALGAAAAVVAFGGLASAQIAAQTPTGTPGTSAQTANKLVRLAGKVDSVSGTGLVLTARNKSVTVNVGSSTWVLTDKSGSCAEGQLSDIQTGKAVAVAGLSTGTADTINARVVAQGRCGVLAARKARSAKPVAAARKIVAQHTAAGTIKSIAGTTLTMTNAKGNDVTIATTSDTIVLNSGFQAVSSLKVGDKVEVLGGAAKAPATNNGSTARTRTAWAIRVDNGTTTLAMGHVTALNGNTATMKTRRDRAGLTVNFDSSTQYKSLTRSNGQVTLANASQSDVTATSRLVVEGTRSADGKTLTAKSVVILPEGKSKTTTPVAPNP